MDAARSPPEITSLASRPSKFKRKPAGGRRIRSQNPGKPEENASTHSFEHLAEMKTGLTSFQRFHSLLMVRLKTRSCSKLLAVQKRVREPSDGWRNHTYFLPGDSRWWDFSLAALVGSGRGFTGRSSSSPLLSFCSDASLLLFCLACPFFYLHVAAPALCQSWQSRLKWARPLSRVLANHGAPLVLLRLSWPIRMPWKITDRLRVSVTDGRTISFKI